MSASELQWANSSGGPLLLLSGEHLLSWSGVELPPEGQHIEATFRYGHPDNPDNLATDYDRACDVNGYLGLLDIGAGQGLVLGDEPLATTWYAFAASGAEHANLGGILIRIVYDDTDSDADIIAAVEQVPASAWIDDGVAFTVDHPPLYLLDATYDASMLEGDDHLTIHLPAGKYSIATAHYEQKDQCELLLHRLTLMSTGNAPEK